MAQRTTDDLVIAVLREVEGDYDAENSPSLARYIKIANLLVNQVAACAIRKGLTQDDEVLTEMETWLAAHYYVQSDQTFTSESTEGASGSYQGSTSKGGVEGSKYGQAALDIDFSGCLNAITKRNIVRAFGLYKAPSEQIPYYQRD